MDAALDEIDHAILAVLQQDGSLSQRDLAERIGLSQNACWRRLTRLRETGVLRGSRAVVAPEAVGLDLTVFMMIRTRHHGDRWAARFRNRVEAIPEVTEFHRIGGEWDYLAKVVTRSMAGYDRVYKTLIQDMDIERVTGLFSMETILADRPLALTRGPAGRVRPA